MKRDRIAQRIGRRQHRRDGRQHGHQQGLSRPHGVRTLLQHHLLGDEPAERRQTRHRGGGQHAQRRRQRHDRRQAAQPPHVARARLMVDDTRMHEQRRLEGRMVEDVKDRRRHRRARPEAEQHHHQPQLADRRIGEDRLQIVAEQRDACAEYHRHQADRRDDAEPQIGSRQHRPQPREEEHPRLHHRRGMEIGADRGRRGHRVGQPEVEGKLRRLGEGPCQDQDQDRRIERRRLHQIGACQDRRQIIAARRLAQQDHARDQRKTAPAGDGQRHSRTLSRVGAVAPETDQEEGRQAGQLPEHQHQQHIAGQGDPDHRPLEQHQEGQEPRRRLVLRQIPLRIYDDEQPDAEDQPGEQQRQRVQPQAEIETECRQPRHACRRRPAGKHRARLRQQNGQPARAGGPSDQHMDLPRRLSGHHQQDDREERHG